MDDIIKLFDGLVRHSHQQYSASLPSNRNSRWKYCVLLIKCGWKAGKVDQRDNDGISIVWHKDSREDIRVDLSFVEQCTWLKYLENEEKNNVK